MGGRVPLAEVLVFPVCPSLGAGTSCPGGLGLAQRLVLPGPMPPLPPETGSGVLAEETACVERTGAALLEAETARSSEAITVVRAQGAGSGAVAMKKEKEMNGSYS